MPIKEGHEADAMFVRKDYGPLFGTNDIYLRSNCVIQSQLGIDYKLPEAHGSGYSKTFLTGAPFSDVDEYEVFFEQ